MARGFVYLVAIVDWMSRKVLSFRLSNSMDADFCVDALKEAIHCYGCPNIFNTDQGSQFTSDAFTTVLKQHHIQISMNGRGRCFDNIFVERLWRTIKYEYVYLHPFDTVLELREGLKHWLEWYNKDRPHQGLNNETPDEVYYKNLTPLAKVA